jgi:hypothetical protein
MRTLRVTALVLLASAWVAFAQPERPCGEPVLNDNEFWFIDQNGESRSFCVRERRRITEFGGHMLWAAVSGSRYCTDIDRTFDSVTNCKFVGTVRCDRKSTPPEFVITSQFRRCRGVFGRQAPRARGPLAKVLDPPGGSVDGAFVSVSGAFLEP